MRMQAAEKFSMTQPTLSYHMRLLSEAGLVETEKDWKWSYYSINKETAAELEGYFAGVRKGEA